MKFLVAVVFVVAISAVNAFTATQIKEGEALAKECIKEIGVAPADVARLRRGNFNNRDEKIQCFTKCFFQKAGFMDASGALNKDKLVESLSTDNEKSKVEELVGKCGALKGASECETAFKVYECYKSNSNSSL